jgi:hypothetical protein
VATHITAEGGRKELIMSWTVSETVFLERKGYSWHSLKKEIMAVLLRETEFVVMTLLVGFQMYFISSHC